MIRILILTLLIACIPARAKAAPCSWLLTKIGLKQDLSITGKLLEAPSLQYLSLASNNEIIKNLYYYWRYEDEMTTFKKSHMPYLNNVILGSYYAKKVFSRYKSIEDFGAFIKNHHILVSRGLGETRNYHGYINKEFSYTYSRGGEFIWEDVRVSADKQISITLGIQDARLGELSTHYQKTMIDDIPHEALPFNDQKQMSLNPWDDKLADFYLHFYPKVIDAKQIFFPKMKELLNKTLQAQGSDDFIKSLVHYFHVAISSHIFPRGNMSVIMGQINALLELNGYNPIPHRNLDYLAMVKSTDELFDDFVKLVNEFN